MELATNFPKMVPSVVSIATERTIFTKFVTDSIKNTILSAFSKNKLSNYKIEPREYDKNRAWYVIMIFIGYYSVKAYD